MKKFGIFALAALLVVAFTVPASALENVFGGYWRTRAYSALDYDGDDLDNTVDLTQVDTRTRLYYTAVFNENLKFVNKFEYNAVWGDNAAGDIGADGNTIVVKNSYADFNMGPVNATVGIQNTKLARGIVFSDDFSGVILTYKGEGFSIPVMWIKAWEGNEYNSSDDVDYYGIAPTFNIGEGISINPFVLYAQSNAVGAGVHANMLADGNDNPWATVVLTGDESDLFGFDELDAWYYGLEANMKFGPASFFLAGILQGGEVRNVAGAAPVDFDLEGASLNLGGSFDFGMFDVHGEWLWFTGEDASVGDTTGLADREVDGWYVPEGMSVFYGEILSGNGSFDVASANNSPGASNNPIVGEGGVNAFNLGAKVKPMDKLTVALDIWYAQLDEEVPGNVAGTWEDDLGTEVDLLVTYELVEGLKLDVLGGYLFTGDAVYNGVNDTDATLLGARLSLSF